MIRLKIDNIQVEVPKGTTVLQAARQLGIDIPTMCHLEGLENNASCLVCMVKDKRSGHLHPSCALQAGHEMDIVTNDEEVLRSRKEALELLLSDHVGDCEAPCRTGCPVFMDIARINRMIAKGQFGEAMKLIKQQMALPLILSHLCEAPCEKVCRRREIDTPVAICQLIKYVSMTDLRQPEPYSPPKTSTSGKKVAIIGSGPAGLACAFHLLEKGHAVTVFDKNEQFGGSLRNSQLKEAWPIEILEAEISSLTRMGAEFRPGITVTPEYYDTHLNKEFDSVVMATGQSDALFAKEMGFHYQAPGTIVDPDTFETGIPGFFACGSVIKPQKMVVKAVAQGKEAAFSVDRYLNGLQPGKPHRMFNSKFGPLQEAEKKEYMKEASVTDRIVPSHGVLTGYVAEEAMKEAARCMHCDCRKLDNCKLRIYSHQYQADRRKYAYGIRKQLVKQDQHEQVIYEPEKCIRCNLCVEITMQHHELLGFTQVGRGFDVQINVPFNQSMKNALNQSAEACVRACPTAAISFKDTDQNHFEV